MTTPTLTGATLEGVSIPAPRVAPDPPILAPGPAPHPERRSARWPLVLQTFLMAALAIGTLVLLGTDQRMLRECAEIQGAGYVPAESSECLHDVHFAPGTHTPIDQPEQP